MARFFRSTPECIDVALFASPGTVARLSLQTNSGLDFCFLFCLAAELFLLPLTPAVCNLFVFGEFSVCWCWTAALAGLRAALFAFPPAYSKFSIKFEILLFAILKLSPLQELSLSVVFVRVRMRLLSQDPPAEVVLPSR